MILALTDTSWQVVLGSAIIVVIGQALMAIIAAHYGRLAARDAREAAKEARLMAKDREKTAVEVEQVKTTLEEVDSAHTKKLDHLITKTNNIEKLVNSPHQIALTLNAANSRWRADKEPTDENREKADLAEKLLNEHLVAAAAAAEKSNNPPTE